MVGLVGECIVSPVIHAYLSRSFELTFQCAIIFLIDLNLSCGKIDGQAGPVVYPAQIGNQNIVDKYPNIIIAGEFVCYRITAVGFPSILLDKTGRHGKAEVVIYPAMHRINPFCLLQFAAPIRNRSTFLHLKHLARPVKREKLSIRTGAALLYPPGMIQMELPGIFIKPCKILLAVVIVIAILVNLKQSVRILEGFLPLFIHTRVKQIGCGFSLCHCWLIHMIDFGLKPFLKGRISILKRILNNPGTGSIARRPRIDTAIRIII